MVRSKVRKAEKYFRNFAGNESTVGILLLFMVALAMVWANSPWAHSYHAFFKQSFTVGFEGSAITTSLHHWINDGLMAYFFFMIGLEIKREVISGSLSTPARAALPVLAAIGGMAVPALLYLSLNASGTGAGGWAIPMATDIAFAIGLLTLAGKAVSPASETLLTATAVVDDIAAILIIAFFLTSGIDYGSLLAAAVYFLIMLFGNLLGIRNFWFYLLVGVIGLWAALMFSGVHATLAGVLAAFTIPARTRLSEGEYTENLQRHRKRFEASQNAPSNLLTFEQVEMAREVIRDSKKAMTPLQRVEENIRPFVNYLVLPVFALANAGVTLERDFLSMLSHPIALGIILGLVLGKFFGVFFTSRFAVGLGLAKLPKGSGWGEVAGISLFSGIGFTMALFITDLAFDQEELRRIAKVGILTGSLIAAVGGNFWFWYSRRDTNDLQEKPLAQ